MKRNKMVLDNNSILECIISECFQIIFPLSYNYIDSFDDVSNFLDYTNITNAITYGAVCEGDESRLTECLVDFRFCQENDDQASVNCSPGTLYIIMLINNI